MGSGSINEPAAGDGSVDSSSDAISDALAALWIKRRPEVVADLQSLIALLGDLQSRADPTDGISDAQAMAHRLHGAFGVFGWTGLKDGLGAIEQALIAGDTAWSDHISAVQRVLASLP